MSKKYPGGLIRKTPPTITPPVDGEGGSAPGVWTLEQASYYTKQGTWPKPIIPREIYTWGENTYGSLGQNNTINRSSPVQVGSLTDWTRVSGGGYWNLAIKLNGTIWSWGYGDSGRTGQGNTTSLSSPVQIGALNNWILVASNSYNGGAINASNQLFVWGDNFYGQLANGSKYNSNSSPNQISGSWAYVAFGERQTFGIRTNGALYAAGFNAQGQLGLNDTDPRSTMTQVGALTNWSKISGGANSTIAIKTDGTMWSWGLNVRGVLGVGDVAYRSSPTQIGALTTWVQSSIGYRSAFAIKTDGTLWSWGSGLYGELGINNRTAYRSSPVQVGSDTNWSYVNASYTDVFAIKTDGTIWAWGRNDNGTLGLQDTASRSSPVQIGSLTRWGQISAATATNRGAISILKTS